VAVLGLPQSLRRAELSEHPQLVAAAPPLDHLAVSEPADLHSACRRPGSAPPSPRADPNARSDRSRRTSSVASGNNRTACAAWLGKVTLSWRPHPMTSLAFSDPAGAPRCRGPCTRSFRAASRLGELSNPRSSLSTRFCGSFQGWAENWASSAVLPIGLPVSVGNAGWILRTSPTEALIVVPKTRRRRQGWCSTAPSTRPSSPHFEAT
jgi:hypothetical protein